MVEVNIQNYLFWYFLLHQKEVLIMNTFDNIKVLAAEQGITIKRLAEKAGIGENSIYRWKKD